MSTVKCHLCPISLPNFDEMEVHISAFHFNYYPYKCLYCCPRELRYFPTEKQIIQHSRVDHPGDISYIDMSDYCHIWCTHYTVFRALKIQVQAAFGECIIRNCYNENTSNLNNMGEILIKQTKPTSPVTVTQPIMSLSNATNLLHAMENNQPALQSCNGNNMITTATEWHPNQCPLAESASCSIETANKTLTYLPSTGNAFSHPFSSSSRVVIKDNCIGFTKEMNGRPTFSTSSPAAAHMQENVDASKTAEHLPTSILKRKSNNLQNLEYVDLSDTD